MRQSIDINCDLGEGIGNEAQLMPHISSCNLACGGHAGDDATIREIVSLSKAHQVGVGAHPSFPDRENFGRKIMEMPMTELKHSVLDQILKVATECEKQNWPMHHIKTHGALYNLCAKDLAYAEMITELVTQNFSEIPIYAPLNSVMATVAQGKIKVLFEAFADRNYNPDGSLVSRSENNAVITDKIALVKHVLRMVKKGEIEAVNGVTFLANIDTVCMHGDTQNAVDLLVDITEALSQGNIKLKLA
ncbi:MAG: 5-oxoprolinase subunit PxpA [Leeuwenhoekiella sp.]